MTDERNVIGSKVRLSRKYFSDMKNGAVFTEGKVYDVIGNQNGRGTVDLAEIVDGSGVLRHINPDYLERAEFSRGDVIKIKYDAFSCGFGIPVFDLEKPREILSVNPWGYATVEDDHGRRREVYFGLLEHIENEVAV